MLRAGVEGILVQPGDTWSMAGAMKSRIGRDPRRFRDTFHSARAEEMVGRMRDFLERVAP